MGLLVVGDVMLAGGVDQHLPRVLRNISTIRSRFPGDALIANLESPICESSLVKGGSFRADPQKCEDVLRLFDAFSVANNHCLDCGETGLRETISFLQHLGIPVVGWRNSDGLQEGTVLTVSGSKVGVLGYVDQGLLPTEPLSTLATCSDYDRIRDEISVLRKTADVILCMLHAGIEMARFPLRSERLRVRRLLECGADIVVRSHSHVVQGYERVGSGLILYGLGDFVFDALVSRRKICAVAQLSGSPLGSSLRVLLIRREADFTVTFLEGRALPKIPMKGERIYHTIDMSVYYVERTWGLLQEYGLDGAMYVLRRVLGLGNLKRLV